jgi:cytochrome c peroxidase
VRVTIPGSFKCLITGFIILFTILAAQQPNDPSMGVWHSVAIFRVESQRFAESTTHLKNQILLLDQTDSNTVTSAREALINARVAYKRIESFMEYFFLHSARIYNRPSKNEIEEPFLEYQAPMGLQYMESMLFEDNPYARKKDLLEQITILESSAKDLNSLLYEFKASDHEILESQRLQLIRVITLGITGFDAPLLKSGLIESYEALLVLKKAIQPYLNKNQAISDSLTKYLDSSLQYLQDNPNFDVFKRSTFLISHALKLQKYLGLRISELGFDLNTPGILNYQAEHIFKPDAVNSSAFYGPKKAQNDDLLKLGRELFMDPILSGNSKISCGTCHPAGNFFQDGLVKSVAFDGKNLVKRNAPPLLYATYQHTQFWDGRAKTLADQVRSVVTDSLEMNGNYEYIIKRISKTKTYRKLFRKAFGAKNDKEAITEQNINEAIAGFVSSLRPFNSDFDRYVNGNPNAMTAGQIRGFDLFMGKAQCGTCHFAPLFNGLIPPQYQLTEFEVIGAPKNADLAKPEYDDDDGRFSFRPIEFYKGAFKTPTVRNVAVTGPYMHNGSFTSLDTLVEFYNKGGGAGLGLDLPYQTLSPNPLNLSEQEKKDIVDFLHALTDDVESTNQ